MTDSDFVRPGGRYPNETVLGAADLRRFDVNQSKLVNDASGGTWNPSAPIGIGGAGLVLSSAQSFFSGGARFRGSSQLVHASGDTTALGPARVRSIVMPLIETVDLSQALQSTTLGGSSYRKLLDQVVQVTSVPSGILLTGVPDFDLAIPGRYLHHGDVSCLSSATLSFRVLNRPDVLPSVLMGFGVAGWNHTNSASPTPAPTPQSQGLWTASHSYSSGQYVLPVANVTVPFSYFKAASVSGPSGGTEPTWNTTIGSSTVDGGVTWQCIGPAGLFYAPTVDAYFAGGNPQTLTCAFDVNAAGGDTLDNSQYRYFAQWFNTPDDSSVLYHSITFNFVNIRSMAFE